MAQPTSADRLESRFHVPVGVLAAALLPLVVLFALFLAEVPIGQPSFLLYRYSPWSELRLERAFIALALGGAGTTFLWWANSHEGTRRFLMLVGAVFCYAGLIVWTFVGPPGYVRQHSFNMLSPSHEGAFVLEGRQVGSIREYVTKTFYQRLEQEPEDMLGRRVLSNPPGVTIVSILVHRLVESRPALRGWCSRAFGLSDLDDPHERGRFASALILAMVFTAVWGGAIVVGYRLCRLWLGAPASTAVAFAMVFNPSTVNFTPGKDPAQIFTVLAILLCWLTAYSRGGMVWGFAAGAVLAASTMIGLVHLWIFAIVAGATFWHSLSYGEGLRPWLGRCALPALAGGLVVVAVAQVTLGWNLLSTAWHVAVRYGQIQLEVITDPFYWTLIGLPMFLLFVGPLFWVQLTALRRDAFDSSASLGGCLFMCTIAVMTYTYFFANNSETPRLWMPFIPLLLVGMALRRSAFRGDTPDHRSLCLLLIVLQFTVTALHFSMMDVRESEWRLDTARMWS